MNKQKIFNSKLDAIYTIIGFIIIIAAIIFLYKIGNSIIEACKELVKNYPTVSVALITGLLGFFGVIVGKIIENKNIIKNKIREEKQTIYIEFLDWIINNVFYAQSVDNEKLTNELREQQKKITIYASDKVLRAWMDFRKVVLSSYIGETNNVDNKMIEDYTRKNAKSLERLILAIRKELGYKNAYIKEDDIVNLYLGI